MRTENIVISGRWFSVSESGEITRLPFVCHTHTGGAFTKKAKVLNPHTTKYGYKRLCLHTGNMFAHRLVYMAFNGPIPDGYDIDHINGDRSDNRISNLRIATRKQNALNRQKANINNSIGIRGVYLHKSSGSWCFAVSGKQMFSSIDKDKVIAYANKYHTGEKA